MRMQDDYDGARDALSEARGEFQSMRDRVPNRMLRTERADLLNARNDFLIRKAFACGM